MLRVSKRRICLDNYSQEQDDISVTDQPLLQTDQRGDPSPHEQQLPSQRTGVSVWLLQETDVTGPRPLQSPPRWPSGRASASRAEGPGFESRLRRDFFLGSSHTSDLKIGTPVATLPGAWRYRVSTGTGRPGVSIL